MDTIDTTLAEEVSKRTTTRQLDMRKEPPLPCEGEMSCTDRQPILSADVLSLTVKNELGEAVPRFCLYDPMSTRSTEYDSERRVIEGPGFGFRIELGTGIPARAGWIRFFRSDFGMMFGIVFGVFAVVANVVRLIHSREVPLAPGLIIAAVAVIWSQLTLRAVRGFPSRYVSTFSGPIPDEIRKMVRGLNGQAPLVLAEAKWRKPTREEERVRYTADPFLVTPCAKGPFHLHVHAQWDVSRGEVLIEEFAEGRLPTSAEKGQGYA